VGDSIGNRCAQGPRHVAGSNLSAMVILDTDHLSVLERREQPALGRLLNRLANLPPSEVATTVISYEEQMRGWMAYLAQARSMVQQIAAYSRLLSHLENYRRIPVLGFDEAAAMEFQRLRRRRLRIGTMDLKIAAIVLSHDATLLSRNLSDFNQVPELHVEDWTSPS
jgi:tRNA(fMet)-specific endonuclease VapC